MTLNSHKDVTPLTKIPTNVKIVKCPEGKYAKSKPQYYLNGRSKTKATFRNAYSS